MAENPLLDTPDRERRIRERAYHLWEADGRPHGRDLDYWERARELIAIEDSAGAGLEPVPTGDPPPVDNVEEAEIQENLGEFPDRFTDQGDEQQTPVARRSPRKRRETPSTARSGGIRPDPTGSATGPKSGAASKGGSRKR